MLEDNIDMQLTEHECDVPDSMPCDEQTIRADAENGLRKKRRLGLQKGVRQPLKSLQLKKMGCDTDPTEEDHELPCVCSFQAHTGGVRESEALSCSKETNKQEKSSEGGDLYGLHSAVKSIANSSTAARHAAILVLATPTIAELPSPRIPQELVDRVISFLWESPYDLDTWKLVSRACYYYVITFSGVLKLDSASSFSVLSKSPTAAEKLRDVHMLYLRDSATPWLHRVPLLLGPALADVTDLHLINWSPARTLHPAVLPAFAHLRSVSELFLYDCRFESVAQLQRLLGAFPGLRMLVLLGVYIPAHKASAEGASSVVCRPPPRLTHLALGNSTTKKPETGEANIAGALAVWFTKDQKRLQELQILSIWLTDSYLREGEAASIGQLVTAVGPHISRLDLHFVAEKSDSSDDVTDCLKLDSCMNVQEFQLIRGSPELNELALLSPDCRIKVLFLASEPWHTKRRATDWAALTTTLEGSAYNDLEVVYNASRIPQSPAEAKLQKAFIARMHARDIEYEDRTEFPFL